MKGLHSFRNCEKVPLILPSCSCSDVGVLVPSLLDRHSGKHTLGALLHNNTMCPRWLTTPWELFQRRALHCGIGVIKRDGGIKQELSLRMDPIHLACNITRHDPNRVRPGGSNSPSLGRDSAPWRRHYFPATMQHMHAQTEAFSRATLIELSNLLKPFA